MFDSMKRWMFALLIALPPCQTNGARPQITIYNTGFALVRETIPLDLQAGQNQVHCTEVTPQIDPGSVILRDPAGKAEFTILEQKFAGQAASKERMLALFEGQTIPFRITERGGEKVIAGKIVRGRPKGVEPIIELDGKYLFELPGIPVFPNLPEGAVLRPELSWKISSKGAAKFDAELSFLTGGLNWEADYNAITAENGNITQFTGWITIKNSVGAQFEQAKIKVVAGEVNRPREEATVGYAATSGVAAEEVGPPAVETRTFDEYHEYALPIPVTLRDGETSQAEFVRARDINSKRSFIYDGSLWNADNLRTNSAILDPQWGTQSSSTVAIVYEFKNDAAHHLGIPLPGGRIHFYRPDEDGQLQFAGDAVIDNTAANELVRLTTGNAFDLAGERKQTEFQINQADHTATESFQIKLRNHRKDKVEIRVREHPARWKQWEITAQSMPSKKIDQHTIEFLVPVAPEEEKTLNYSIRYIHLPVTRGQR